jgi:hypothetical protein
MSKYTKKYYFDGLGTTNHELIIMCQKNKLNLKIDDIIMADQIPLLKKTKNHNYIINLGDFNTGGSHWVFFSVRKNNCCYIDSFGGLPNKEVIEYVRKNKLSCGYSNYICQTIKSTRCGIYCINALKHMQNCNENNIFTVANDYVNIYEPIFNNTNEKIVMKDLILKK